MIRNGLMLVALSLLVASVCSAYPCHSAKKAARPCETVLRNPDGRTSITLTGSVGSLDGMNLGRDADTHGFGAALVYPASNDLSLLLGYGYAKNEWNGAPVACGLTDWHTNTYTVGVRFYLGR